MEREFKGVWIPSQIWTNKELTWTEKILLVEIDSLSELGQCFASNSHFAEFAGLSKDRVTKVISSLKDKGYIDTKLIYKEGGKEVEKRIITTGGYRRKCLEGIGENAYPPIGENAYSTNTSITNTITNTDTSPPVEVVASESKLEAALEAFISHRKSLKKPLSQVALKLLRDKLSKMTQSEDEQIAILNHSIINGWKDVFEPKQLDANPKSQNFKQNTISSMTDDEARAIARRKADRRNAERNKHAN